MLSGVGTHKLSLAGQLHPKRAAQLIVPNGLAGMGLALPRAIAAARLCPDRQLLAVCGDGDAMMNVQEMELASRLGLGLAVVVCLDGGYGLVETKKQADTGTLPDLSFEGVDWAHLAAALVWRHAAARTRAELTPTPCPRPEGRADTC